MSGINTFFHSGGAQIINAGQQAVTASATALPSIKSKAVLLKASEANAISIYIGDSTVTVPGGANPGFSLAPGDGVSIPVDNTDRLYVIAATTGATVEWVAEGL